MSFFIQNNILFFQNVYFLLFLPVGKQLNVQLNRNSGAVYVESELDRKTVVFMHLVQIFVKNRRRSNEESCSLDSILGKRVSAACQPISLPVLSPLICSIIDGKTFIVGELFQIHKRAEGLYFFMG